MNRRRKMFHKPGSSPGTLIHVGERKVDKAAIRLLTYDERQAQEAHPSAIGECFPLDTAPTVSWINVNGLHEADLVDAIGKRLDLHPLLLEDILNTGQRPKMEDYSRYVFVVLKMLAYDEQTHNVEVEQVSIVLGETFVVSFQEGENDVFEPVRQRVLGSKGKIRRMQSDYLAYALIDAVVDHYFLVLERIGERIDEIEATLLSDPTPITLEEINRLKKEIIVMRKFMWPLREVISVLERGDSTLIQETTRIFLRDVHDHIIQVIDTVETYREMVAGLVDMYLSFVSNRMNQVMKVLTIIATLFIPLTFIAGIYGMNFEYMPELKWPWAYPVLWLIMLVLAGGMLVCFKKRRWL